MNFDVVIIGGGMVGLSLANQLIERKITNNIIVLDKEKELGKHSSGLNSGVLHAGLYYEPDSLKARVCVSGATRLKKWIKERNLPINECGKVIVPQREELDSQLDILYNRGKSNGAKVEMIDENELNKIAPEALSSSGRALWSPNTVVVKSKLVLNTLENELIQKNVKIVLHQNNWKVNIRKRMITLNNGDEINYSHLINCAGLQADKVARLFGVGRKYILFPFKGLYWSLKRDSKIRINTNVYPVPDLNVPFLGVHFTPTADDNPTVNIGPTATPALGRENYRGFESLEFFSSIRNLSLLANQYLLNKGGFRKYVHEQYLLTFKPIMIQSAQQLIPRIRYDDVELSNKVGIRSQLFNTETQRLEDDFLCLEGPDSTHVMNAISPAFTASFTLADLIIDNIRFNF